MTNSFLISKDTIVQTDFTNDILRNAASILRRDILKTVTAENFENVISLKLEQDQPYSEEFKISLLDSKHIQISSSSEIGVMYGVLNVSKNVLGIDDFWFWLDSEPKQRPYVEWTNWETLRRPDFHVKYRGWFINDELLLNHWDYYESNDYVWQIIFETLLRCGGNVVIPGTDSNSHLHRKLASQMGLTIAHHHAEPLGAEMFSRVYPDLEASYLKYPKLFEKIWQDSIDQQKDSKVIWNIGFRGQGDRPFWEDDDHPYTLVEKANVINSVIKKQYLMVKQADPNAICSMNIYGELTALYNSDLLKIPDDVIQIWADNGYGKMISRRQGNDDPRSEILSNGSSNLSQGIYYHVAFHDLQASNFLTLLQINPNYVANELSKVRDANMDDLVIVNTGNIKPHVFYLHLVAKSWLADFNTSSDQQIISSYVDSYYSSLKNEVTTLYDRYFKTTFNYRNFADQKAGDEFYTYTIRKLIVTWITQRPAMPEMEWLTGNKNFIGQLVMIDQLITSHVGEFEKLAADSQILMKQLNPDDYKRFFNDIWLSIAVHSYSIQALKLTLNAFDAFTANDFTRSFLLVNDAKKSLKKLLNEWANNPTPKWVTFYNNDCYTNITLTIDILASLEDYIRVIGDGPDEDTWERQFLMQKSDARVMLLSNTHKAYGNDEIAIKLKSSPLKSNFD